MFGSPKYPAVDWSVHPAMLRCHGVGSITIHAEAQAPSPEDAKGKQKQFSGFLISGGTGPATKTWVLMGTRSKSG